jgi:hypothetical protein
VARVEKSEPGGCDACAEATPPGHVGWGPTGERLVLVPVLMLML